MTETVNILALAGACSSDCLVDAFVMAVFSSFLSYTVDNNEH